MKKFVRVLLPAVLVLGLVGALAGIKASQIGLLVETGKAAEEEGPPPETVATAEAKADTWKASLSAVGNVEAERGVTLSNDSPGIVTRVNFDSGDEVDAGEVVIELETNVERAQLASIQARLDLARTTLTRTSALVAQSVATQAELDNADAEVKRLQAEAAALRAQIERKVVRAPFAGRIGIRQVNLGQYLAPGSPLATIQSDEKDYVDFALPQQHLTQLSVGLPVRLRVEQADIDLDGVVAAIDPDVDQRTRSVTLRATTTDPEKRLRPGMFVNVRVILDKTREVVTVPTTAILFAPYGDSVFVVESESEKNTRKVARQRFVRLGETRGDFVEVHKGLEGGETVVSAGAFKLRNGSAITINNEVGLEPQLDPQPDNR